MGWVRAAWVAAFCLAYAGAAGAQSWTGRGDTPSPPPEGARSHRVTIANKEVAAITAIFISPPTTDDWGDDLLGADVLEPGMRREITFDGPCRMDVRIGFEGESQESRRYVDLCENSTLVIEPGWTLKPMTTASRP